MSDEYEIELHFPNVTRVFHDRMTRGEALRKCVDVFSGALSVNGTGCKVTVTLRDSWGNEVAQMRSSGGGCDE